VCSRELGVSDSNAAYALCQSPRAEAARLRDGRPSGTAYVPGLVGDDVRALERINET
jgi:hypothetical protein